MIPTNITISGNDYDCPKTYKHFNSTGAVVKRPKEGHIFINQKGWAKPTEFQYPTRRYKVGGTDAHPVLTSRI